LYDQCTIFKYNIQPAHFKSVGQEVDHYQWIGYDNKPIYPADAADPLLAMDKITQAAQSAGADYDAVIENGGVNNILIFSKESGLILATQISQAKLLEQYNWFIFYYVLSILIMVAVILIAALPMMRRQLKPLQQLSAMMKTFSTLIRQ
jgi:sensor histidine kinase YesM